VVKDEEEMSILFDEVRTTEIHPPFVEPDDVQDENKVGESGEEEEEVTLAFAEGIAKRAGPSAVPLVMGVKEEEEMERRAAAEGREKSEGESVIAFHVTDV
jgi:hypothetical protein